MLRHLSRFTAVQLRVPIGILDFEEVGERGCSADAAGSRPASWQWLAMASPTVPFPPPYGSQRVLQRRLSCQVAGGGGVRSGDVLRL